MDGRSASAVIWIIFNFFFSCNSLLLHFILWFRMELVSAYVLLQMAACWKSPQFCDEIECGNHGKCVEKVDHGICVCQSGWTGSACSINPNLLFSFGMSNDTDPLVKLEVKKMVMLKCFHQYFNKIYFLLCYYRYGILTAFSMDYSF